MIAIAVSTIQLTSIILILILFLLGFKILETNWSYKISKPYQWDVALNKGDVSGRLIKMERSYRDKVRFYTFWFQIERLKRDGVNGTFAEVGVYKGETAGMIHEMDPRRSFLLFDTFEGFSKRDLQFESADSLESGGVDFKDTSLELAKEFIQGNENVQYFPGHFPETASSIPEQKFALVHLDADLYHPTLEGLRYFYPRLSPGGVMLVHDYNHNWEGVRRAVDEFAHTIDESLALVSDWQGSVIIVRNRGENKK